MKKTILFLLLDQWSDWEAAYLSSAIQMLGGDEYCVKTVSIKEKEVLSLGGFRVNSDYSILFIPEEYEALILIGGMSWRKECYKEIEKIVKECLKKEKILGAICDAAGFLGTIGILNNRKHTCNDLMDLKKWAGNKYLGEKYFIGKMSVCDNKVITANGTASLEFARDILLNLEKISKESIEKWYSFNKLGCYTVN